MLFAELQESDHTGVDDDSVGHLFTESIEPNHVHISEDDTSEHELDLSFDFEVHTKKVEYFMYSSLILCQTTAG